MLQTYSGMLRNGQIEWGRDGAPVVAADRAVPVHITVLDQDSDLSNGPAMAEALEAIARTGGVKGIEHPVDWQRKSRADRPQPDRES